MPACDGVRCGDDWKLIPKFSRNDAWLTKQIDLTKRILDRCEPGHFTMGTLHGVVASSLHLIEKRYGYDGGRLAQPEHLRQNKVAVADVYKRIADILCVLAEEYIKAGLDSVYYAALGGEYRYYTDEEFETFIAPLDKQVMTAIERRLLRVTYMQGQAEHASVSKLQRLRGYCELGNLRSAILS